MNKATIFNYARMCKNMKKCENCPLGINNTGEGIACSYLIREIPDKANEIILNWCKEHPIETRQKAEIENEIKEIKSEAVKEFADKINELLAHYSHLHNNAENAIRDTITAVDGTDIEMQSVWDVFTLKNNEMAEYEEMSRLQENIETIANERLLREIEKDFRLFVKEMTEVQE